MTAQLPPLHMALTEWLITGGFTILCIIIWFSLKRYLTRTDETHKESAEAVGKLTEQTILLAEKVQNIQFNCLKQENENWRRLNSHSESIKILTESSLKHEGAILEHDHRLERLEK